MLLHNAERLYTCQRFGVGLCIGHAEIWDPLLRDTGRSGNATMQCAAEIMFALYFTVVLDAD